MHQRADPRATRLAEQQSGLRVDVDEHNFHHRAVGLVALHHLAHPVKQDFEAVRQCLAGHFLGADGAAGNIAQGATLLVNHAKARGAQPWVDAQNSHRPASLGTRASGMRPTMTCARLLRYSELGNFSK